MKPANSLVREESRERTRRLLFMYGAAPLGELNAMLEKNSLDTAARKESIRQEWKGASRYYSMVIDREGGAPENVATRALAPSISELAGRFSRIPEFRATFASFDVTFEDVELDLLVAAQGTVDLDFAASVGAGLADPLARASLLLAPRRGPAALTVVPTGHSGYALACDHPGMLLAGSIEAPYQALNGVHPAGGQLVHAITLLIGLPIDTANAYRVGKRLILNNGFHRVFAIRQAGFTHAPLAIINVCFPELELPGTMADFPSDYLVKARRPALLKDFFDPKMVCELNVHARTKVLQLTWACQSTFAPRQGAL